MNNLLPNLFGIPMFKDTNTILKMANIIQIHFHQDDSINFMDNVGNVANCIEKELKRLMPQVNWKPALHRLNEFPYMQLEVTIPDFSLIPTLQSQLPAPSYLQSFKIDAQNVWINSNNTYIDTWFKDYLNFLRPIFSKIGVKYASRIGILTTYQTSLDNIENAKIFVNPNFKFISSVLDVKVKDGYNTKLTFEINEQLKLCRLHWDVGITGKLEGLEEKINKILADNELDFMEVVKKSS